MGSQESLDFSDVSKLDPPRYALLMAVVYHGMTAGSGPGVVPARPDTVVKTAKLFNEFLAGPAV